MATVQTVSNVQYQVKRDNSHPGLVAVGGALAGAAARYVVPSKSEFSSMFNKEGFDSFVSSAARTARGEQRSVLKYGGIGALAALGVAALVKAFKGNKEADKTEVEYTKLGALIDAPDYACAAMWYVE